ncbi:hypothetical protein J6590_062575 [Homalodisca vitripennis]|nr:hypothetical protein J6590_062575 [Homalodisca vitripennis]
MGNITSLDLVRLPILLSERSETFEAQNHIDLLGLKLLHQNTDDSKLLELERISQQLGLDFIAISEHWQTAESVNSSINGFLLTTSQCREPRKHGGLAVFVRTDEPCTIAIMSSSPYYWWPLSSTANYSSTQLSSAFSQPGIFFE